MYHNIPDQLQGLADVLRAVVADDHSFTRGYFSLGLQPWNVSNVMGDSPLQKNSDTIRVSNLAATGFAKAGDRLCWPLTVSPASGLQSFARHQLLVGLSCLGQIRYLIGWMVYPICWLV